MIVKQGKRLLIIQSKRPAPLAVKQDFDAVITHETAKKNPAFENKFAEVVVW